MGFAAAVATSADSSAGGHRGARWREKQFCHCCPQTWMFWGREWWNSHWQYKTILKSMAQERTRLLWAPSAVPSMQKPRGLPVWAPQHSLWGWKLVLFKPWTSQSSVLILDDWTCLPANALHVRLTPLQLLLHFIFSKKKQLFLSASDFKSKRCSISPEQDFSNSSSAMPNLKLSTKRGS